MLHECSYYHGRGLPKQDEQRTGRDGGRTDNFQERRIFSLFFFTPCHHVGPNPIVRES